MFHEFSLTWCSWNFFPTLEGALSKALCHPGQQISTVSDLEKNQESCETNLAKCNLIISMCLKVMMRPLLEVYLDIHVCQSLLLVLKPTNNPQQALNPWSGAKKKKKSFNAVVINVYHKGSGEFQSCSPYDFYLTVK